MSAFPGNRAWLLGAEDPEMVAIEKLLRAAGETVAHAMADGAKVTPATAYRATDADASVDCDGTLYLVECGLAEQFTAAIRGTVVIDHHRPGDPGYGKGPEEFLAASSLGQVLLALAAAEPSLGLPLTQAIGPWHPFAPRGTRNDQWATATYLDGAAKAGASFRRAEPPWELVTAARNSDGQQGVLVLTDEVVFVAAADHCLAAAYAGQCPGVDPAALREFRERQLCSASRASARGQERTVEEVRASIDAALRAVVAAPRVVLGGVEVADCRGPMVPDLPEAAMLAGLGYLAGGVPLRDGDRAKVVIGGCGAGTVPGEEPVRDFLSRFAAEQGLVESYGDPARGFAGAYLP